MWFYEDWKDDLNPLLSMHDLFVTDKGIFEELQQGFPAHLRTFMKRALAHVRRACAKPGGEAYQWYWDHYLRHLDPDHLDPFQGILLLDSGGFVLGNPKSWPRMKSVRNGRGAEIADLMAQLKAMEANRDSSRTEYLRVGQEAQRIVLETGLAVRPDILVTLDRVIHYESPADLKDLYVQYNIANAHAALRMKSEASGKPFPMLWPVLHPWGPSLSEIKAGHLTPVQATEAYYRGYSQQLTALLGEERILGVQYDGFGLGSLVPISDSNLLGIIGKAVSRALMEHGVAERPLHAFGSTEPKALKLHEYGISSFDSTHHTVRARTRQALYPIGEGQYQRVGADLVCPCQVCRKHRTNGLDEYLENRKGVKEVATVLLALHNYHASERAYLEPMRRLEETRFPV